MIKTIIHSVLYMFGLADNPICETEKKSDAEWLADDWQRVGMDLRNAMNAYERQAIK